MNADCKGALAQLNQSYKSFVHNGNSMSKQAVKKVLEYAISKGYDHTGLLRDAEIDTVLTPGTTIEQWERYYKDAEEFETKMRRAEPNRTNYTSDVYGGFCEESYQQDLAKWRMAYSCDAPNKPGYYRANND